MRNQFIETTAQLMDERPDVAVVLADIGVTRFIETGMIDRHPDRIVNVGIREQLMIGVAAGFALEGFKPIAHSYTPFLVERPFEQIKLGFAHQGVDGVLVSIGSSFDASSEGRTHQAPEDVALISSLPGWSVMAPGHADETAALLRDAVETSGSSYIRLADDTNREAHITPPGQFAVVRQSTNAAPLVIAVGPMLDPTMEATRNIDATVLYASTIRPFDAHTVAQHIGSGEVVIVEPYLEGTSASEAAEALISTPHRLLSIGVPKGELRNYGSAKEHRVAHGLDAVGLAKRIDSFVTSVA
ncbi:MAG: transketolase family protein [Acidimicrobiia bacterium]